VMGISRNRILQAALFVLAAAFLLYSFRTPIWDRAVGWIHLFSDREKVGVFIESFGLAAPVAFIFIQILQVVLAPIPGEVSGFVGGYLFGAVAGFLYSSIGLTVGSWINFSAGRLLGRRFVGKLISRERFQRFDRLLKRQGVIIVCILFVFPGFPKDLLCLFLGLSSLPLRLFLVIAAVGRMPGTIVLSIQGAFVYNRNYDSFFFLLALCLAVALVGVRYQEAVYKWVDRFNKTGHGS